MGSGSGEKGICTGASAPFPTTFQRYKMDKNRKRERSSVSSRIVQDVRKKCHRRSGQEDSRILFHLLPGSEERRRLASSPELETTEQVHEIHQVQDGNQRVNPCHFVTGRLAGKPGSEGCILPCSSLASPQAVPPICIQRKDISVQSLTIRTINSPSSVYHALGPNSGSYTPRGNTVPPLSGRLSDHSKIQDSPQRTCTKSHPDTPQGRFPSKLEEVRPGALSRSALSRHEIAHRFRDGPIARRSRIRYSKVRRALQGVLEAPGSPVSQAAGTDGGMPTSGADGSIKDAADPTVFAVSLGSGSSEPRPQIGGSSLTVTTSAVLDGCPQTDTGSTTEKCTPHSNCDNRCVVHSLGGIYRRRSQSPRSLEKRTPGSAYQLPRDVGSNIYDENFSQPPTRQGCSRTYRQCFGQTIHQQLRRHEVTSTLCPRDQATVLVSDQSYHLDSRAYSREREHIGRSLIQKDIVPNRMVTEQQRGQNHLQQVGGATDGPICHCRQQEDNSVLQLAARLSGIPCRCLDPIVVGHAGLCLSTDRTDPQSGSEGNRGRGDSNSDRPLLAESSVVPIDPTSADRRSNQTSAVPRPANAAERDAISLQPGLLVPGSLEDKRRFLANSGLSAGVARTLVAARSDSTYAAYESGWRHFTRWCGRRQTDPFTTSIERVLAFLQYCLTKRKLAHSTIRNRVYAIALFHRTLPLEKLSQHVWVKDFLKGAKRQCPRLKNPLPKWNLQLVLQSMRGHPFEPMNGNRLGWVTWKTAFIVGITTARRVGEVQALSVSDRYLQITPEGVRLRLNPFFVPKVNTRANRESEIFMTPFCPVTDPDSRNTLHLVCSCRAIRKYVEITKPFRRTDQFFVCYDGAKKGQAAHKTTIARWMRRGIQEAYRARGMDPPADLRAHQVRGMAATWAQFNHTNLTDICQAATWSSGCTFAKHYQLNLAGNCATARFAANVLQTVLDRRPT